MTARIVILSRGDGEGSQNAHPEILRCAQDDGASLPKHPYAQLHLTRIAGAAAHGAVEVEDQTRHLRTNEVLAVERVENVDGRLGDDAAHMELLGKPEIERRELVVLAPEVTRDGAARAWKRRRGDSQTAVLWGAGRLTVDTQRQRLRR